MKRLLPAPALLIAFFLGAAPAHAEGLADTLADPLDPWHITGENSLHYDYYLKAGNKDNSIYPFDSNKVYNETRIAADRRLSLYESIRFSASGLLNGSEYRNDDYGWVFEDVRAGWQKGDASIPFRLDAGDYTESLSYRTIQQNLKGIQVEVQPHLQIGSLEQRHSLLLFSGLIQKDYRRLELDHDISSGGSWLVDLARFGTVGFNIVHNHKEADHPKGQNKIGQRDQVTWSTTYEKIFTILKQHIGVQAEMAHFAGDSLNFSNEVTNNESDPALYFKLDGSSDLPLTYGFRYDQTGRDFMPAGGVVSPNRRTLEWTAGWQFANGMRLDGRTEIHNDNLEGANRYRTNVYGLTFSGPLENPLLRDLQVYSDINLQELLGVDRYIDNRTVSWAGDINSAVYKEWRGHFAYAIQNTNDRGYDYLTINRQFSFDVSHPVNFMGFYGSARGGNTFRNSSGLGKSYQYGPDFMINLIKGPHQLDYSAEYLWNFSYIDFGQDVSSFRQNARYSFNFGPHSVSLDFEVNNRNPYEYEATEDYRMGVLYTFRFDKPAGTDIRDFSWKNGYSPAQNAVLEQIRAEQIDGGANLLEGLFPGQLLSDATAYLEARGISHGADSGNFRIYETRIFNSVHQRQRLVLEHDGQQLIRTAVIVDLDRVKDGRDAERTYEDIRRFYLKLYGNPSADTRDGDFSDNFKDLVNAGQLLRMSEWQPSQGTALRLGIPRRLDRKVRIEIQKAASFPSPRDPGWSLESVP